MATRDSTIEVGPGKARKQRELNGYQEDEGDDEEGDDEEGG